MLYQPGGHLILLNSLDNNGSVYMQRFLPILLNTFRLQIKTEVFVLTLLNNLMKISVYMLTTSNQIQNYAHA